MKNIVFQILLFTSLITNSFAQSLSNNNADLKPWLLNLIETKRIGISPITNIKSYIYKDEIIYLVNFEAGCCAHYSAVLKDENGNTICHPFGGFSGKGDMQCTDFLTERKDENLIWLNDNIEKVLKEKEGKSFKMTKSEN